MNGKVYALPIGKGSSLPEEKLTKYVFQCFNIYLLLYIPNMIHLSTFSYTRYTLDVTIFLIQASTV